jgi:hypothetical protein
MEEEIFNVVFSDGYSLNAAFGHYPEHRAEAIRLLTQTPPYSPRPANPPESRSECLKS